MDRLPKHLGVNEERHGLAAALHLQVAFTMAFETNGLRLGSSMATRQREQENPAEQT
jgi:hypothetical protein